MAPMKRPAAAPAGGTAKKPTLASPAKSGVLQQCSVVEAAVLRAESFPEVVRKMVVATTPACLGIPKEDRHAYQEKMIANVGEILASVEADGQKRVDDMDTKISSGNDLQVARNQAQEAAALVVANRMMDMEAAKVELAETATQHKAAKASFSEAEVARGEGDALLFLAVSKKEKMESILKDSFVGLKEGTFEGSVLNSHISIVVKLGKEIELDNSMLIPLPTALAKTPSERGAFDNMMFEQLEGELQKRIKALEETLASGESSKAERAAKVESAQAATENCRNNLTLSAASFKESKARVEEAKAELKAAAKAVSQFGPEMKQAEKDLASAKCSLEAFMGGAMAEYKKLLEFTKVVAPLPASETEPAGDKEPAVEEPAVQDEVASTPVPHNL